MITLAAKPVVEALQKKAKERSAKFLKKHGRRPKLAVVLVGDDPASVIYTTNKGKACVDAGLDHETVRLPASSKPATVRKKIEALNKSKKTDGILLQQPLPNGFDLQEVYTWVTPAKDVDGFHPMSKLTPCTPSGVMEILKFYKIPVTGKIACVIGRSAIVGKPMAALLLRADATVIQCHSKTRDLPALCRQADIVVAAMGKPGAVDKTFIKPGATVIDVGIHRVDGKVVGDVRSSEVARVAGALTPVPGGVGPMTIALLIQNTLDAAECRASS